ncbi:MAG: alpha-glucan family phosphorylase [Proteobacteria bacterium]|nr:alpha-glucan family phosphorylase [Pseudomonadota bacterium]
MSHLKIFQVYPNIPKPLFFLEELSQNLWWSWKPHAVELFRRIDPRLWENSERNPIVFLSRISQERFEELAKDESFLAHQGQVKEKFGSRVSANVNLAGTPFGKDGVIAYFSMEYGIHESLPFFAGGLGILAGDFLKASSNLAFPLVGVGLLYRQGYFRQYLNQDGIQQEIYHETDLYNIPLERVCDSSGKEIKISLTGPDGEFHVIVWKIMVGCVPLYLLDTNIPENSQEIRDITSRLYADGQKVRLIQEVLLGIGGMRALEAIGIFPAVCHMNEGHSAFSSIERISQFIKRYNVDLKTALEIIPRTTVFTTHTPVAAGYDEFPNDIVRPFIRPLCKSLNTTEDEILSWGKPIGADPNEPFSMFVLGIRMAQYCNGVSKLHGDTVRKMWSFIWPKRAKAEVPITYITNGVHLQTFLSHEYTMLFERYIGPDWFMKSRAPNIVRRIGAIYDEELWRAHEMNRSRLIGACRDLMAKQYGRRNAPKSVMQDVESVLDHDILTIGFARRFASYKRATLLLKDTERLEAIINSKTRPVQFIFAGKAHPKDNEGKELIKKIIKFSSRPSVRHRFIFLEDYDMHLAGLLVQGSDVWLNTPRRPFEACGTSGMKAAINGALNLSVLDGWWCEGYSEEIERGWCIGGTEEYSDPEYQDSVEAQALYNILENDVIPAFYERKNGACPARWVKMMKESIKMAMENFCSLRMVSEYRDRFYIPAIKRLDDLLENDAKEAREIAAQREKLRKFWSSIRVGDPVGDEKGPFSVGDSFNVDVVVNMGELSPEELEVHLVYGALKSLDELSETNVVQMKVLENRGGGEYLYNCKVPCGVAGRYGFTARIISKGDDWIKHAPGLIAWALKD